MIRKSESNPTQSKDTPDTGTLIAELNDSRDDIRRELALIKTSGSYNHKKQQFSLKGINTFGALGPHDLEFLEKSSTITLEQLRSLSYECLQLTYICQALEECLQITNESSKHPVRVYQIIKILTEGSMYKYLRKSMPVCIINNRTTAVNIRIFITSIMVYSAGKLNIQLIKQSLNIFCLEQKKLQIEGILLELPLLMSMFKIIGRTIAEPFLVSWIKKNNFQINHFLQPYQFLYLVCLTHDRETYLRKIPKLNFKNRFIPGTNLSQIQPADEIVGTPDEKIQKQLALNAAAINEEYARNKHQNAPSQQNPTSIHKVIGASDPNAVYIATDHNSKSTQKLIASQFKILESRPRTRKTKQKELSSFRKMLRNESIYQQIRECLEDVTKQKPQLVKRCINSLNPEKKQMTRPVSSINPIVKDFFSLAEKDRILDFQKSKHTFRQLRSESQQKQIELVIPDHQADQNDTEKLIYHPKPFSKDPEKVASASHKKRLYTKSTNDLMLIDIAPNKQYSTTLGSTLNASTYAGVHKTRKPLKSSNSHYNLYTQTPTPVRPPTSYNSTAHKFKRPQTSTQAGAGRNHLSLGYGKNTEEKAQKIDLNKVMYFNRTLQISDLLV